jgi:hypothetical protein
MSEDADVKFEARIGLLDHQIEQKEREKAEKIAELKSCEKNTQGFKIAGIATLAATGAGVIGNIALHEKLSSGGSGSGGGAGEAKGAAADTRSQEEVSADNEALFAELGI